MLPNPIAVVAGLVLAVVFIFGVLVLAVFELGKAAYEFDVETDI